MPAVVADANGPVLVYCDLLLVPEYFYKKRDPRKEDPFHRDPPPSDEYPPENAVMLVFKLNVVDDLNVNVAAAAFFANHSMLLFTDGYSIDLRIQRLPFQADLL